MKKTVFSALFISCISVAVAQVAVKENQSSQVEVKQTSKNVIIGNSPVKLKGEAVMLKGTPAKKSVQPNTERQQFRAVLYEPNLKKENTKNKR